MRSVYFPSGFMMAVLLSASALAQNPNALNDCAGQPVLTAAHSGNEVTVNAFPSGTNFTDSINTAFGNGCASGVSNPDSVVCFTPENFCSISIVLETGTNEPTHINLITGCATKPPACLESQTGIGSAGVNAFLVAGLQVCIVGSTFDPPTTATYRLMNTSACGALGPDDTPIFTDDFESGNISARSIASS